MPALSSRSAATLIAFGGAAALAAAWYFQYVLGYQPCALCLWQRWPYYLGIPLAAFGALTGRRDVLFLVALLFAGNALLGLYHAGIEWKFWPGPASCSSGAAALGSGNLLQDLQHIRIVPCDAAPWRFLGLSFAGWNMAICAGLAALACAGLRKS